MPTHDVRAAAAALLAVALVAACSPQAAPAPTSTRTAGEPAPTWETTFTASSPAVARVTATGCAGTGSGTGFLVAPDTLVTAQHVVGDATAISLRFGSEVVSGETVAVDADLALVRVSGTVRADPLRLADEPSDTDAPVAALGYRLRETRGVTPSDVPTTDLVTPGAGTDRQGLFRTDAPLDPGSSGAPILTIDGTVVGVAAGPDATSPSEDRLQALHRLLESEDRSTPPSSDTCDSSWDWDPIASEPVQVTVTSDHPDAPAIAQTVQLYAESVNAGYMSTVWNLLTPRMQERAGSMQHYAAALSTSAWHQLEVEQVSAVDDTTDTAVVAFRTTQDPEHGPGGATCTDWRVTYTLAIDAGTWQIDGARATDDVAATACAEDDATGD